MAGNIRRRDSSPPQSVLGGRRRTGSPSSTKLMTTALIVILLCVGPVRPCGPGRGSGQRRGPRKMTPLVFKQHVPNVSEQTLGASGPAEGRITSRSDSRFKDLVVNNNPDIVFKDEEGTGADRMMSQRCRDKLNTLAVLVMNQWPGVRLRVTETWTETHSAVKGQRHAMVSADQPAASSSLSASASAAGVSGAGSSSSSVAGAGSGSDSLHYEGRAVDITTSDRDRTKYGMLARLAVEAGFDWVYYESRSHIHCSVKSDSSIASNYGGCFAGQSTVRLESGSTTSISDLKVGDKVMTYDSGTGRFRFDPVVAFIHRNSLVGQGTLLQTIETVNGHRLTLTPGHLIYSTDDPSTDIADVQPTFAGSLQVGKYIYVSATEAALEINATSSLAVAVKIKHIDVAVSRQSSNGVFAPLTSSGNIVVDDVVASCYAAFDSHKLAHWSMLPLVYAHQFSDAVERWLLPFPLPSILPSSIFPVCNDDAVNRDGGECTHWYAHALRSLTSLLGPSSLWYNGAL